MQTIKNIQNERRDQMYYFDRVLFVKVTPFKIIAK